jgi:polysaccharide export outer membrane protein
MLMKTLLTSFSLAFLLSTAPAVAQTPSQPAGQPIGTSGAAASDTAATAPTNTNAASTAKPSVAADYKLVPGDKLRVEVYKDAQLSQSVQVRPDGKITLPLANDVVAAGRTPTELRDAIVSSLKPYIASPTVTVMVVETVPPVFYVMGEVNAPGTLPLTGRVDVLQGLAMAKGFTDFANKKDIKIKRGSQLIKFNYNDAVAGNGSPVYLQPGDTVLVR